MTYDNTIYTLILRPEELYDKHGFIDGGALFEATGDVTFERLIDNSRLYLAAIVATCLLTLPEMEDYCVYLTASLSHNPCRIDEEDAGITREVFKQKHPWTMQVKFIIRDNGTLNILSCEKETTTP